MQAGKPALQPSPCRLESLRSSLRHAGWKACAPGYAPPMRLALFLLLAAALQAQAPPPAAAPRELVPFVILHTNDVHGQIRPLPDPRSRDGNPRMLGGYQELVAAIDEERAQAPQSLLVDAG